MQIIRYLLKKKLFGSIILVFNIKIKISVRCRYFVMNTYVTIKLHLIHNVIFNFKLLEVTYNELT